MTAEWIDIRIAQPEEFGQVLVVLEIRGESSLSLAYYRLLEDVDGYLNSHIEGFTINTGSGEARFFSPHFRLGNDNPITLTHWTRAPLLPNEQPAQTV